MASSNESVVGALRADLSFGAEGFQQGVVKIARETDKLNKKITSTNPVIGRMEGSFKKLEGQISRLESKINSSGNMFDKFKGFIAPLAAAASVSVFASIADNWSDMTSRIGAATKDMEGAPQVMQEMLRLANASYSDIGQTVEIFSRNVGVMADLGFSTEETLDFTEALNHALVITATKGERAASVQNALAKAMATGKLDAEGLETVLNNGGRVAEALAKSFGTTVSGLRKLQQQGKLTGKAIAEALLGELQNVRKEAGEMPTTIADGFLKIRNSTTALIGSIDQQFGASAAAAGWLNSISEGIATLAQADFGSVLKSMADGATTLATALAILATGRIPALLGSLAAVNVASLAMTAQFTAGALASRAMTVAMNIQAAAARGLSAAMAFVGGPIGLAVIAAASLGVSYHNMGANSASAAEAVKELAAAQETLTSAARAFDNLQTVEAFNAYKVAAQDALASAKVAVEETRKAFESAVAWDFWISEEDLQAARQAFINANVDLIKAQAEVDNLKNKIAELGPQFGIAVEAAKALTEEQIKANISAMEMAETYRLRAQLQQVENQYGRESLQYLAIKNQQEREALEIKLAAMDIEQSVRQAVLDSYDASQRATNQTQLWKIAVEGLKNQAEMAYDAISKVANTEPGSGWLDTAINKAAKLATNLWDAVKAKAGIGDNPMAMTSSPRPMPKGQGTVIDLRNEGGGSSGGGGGGGGSSGGGGKSEAEIKAEREKDALKGLKERVDSLGKTWWMTTEARAAYEEAAKIGVAATPAEIAALQGTEEALKKKQEAMDQVRNSFVSNFEGMLTGAKSFKDALGGFLADIASMLARSALSKAFAGMMGDGGGFFGKIFGFSSGGYTGSGGKYDPAGIVHKGEYVFSKASVDKLGLGFLDKLHNGGGMPELVHLNRGSSVMNNASSMRAVSGGGGTTRILLEQSPEVRASIIEEAKGNSVSISTNAVNSYRKSGLNRDIKSFQNDPRKV